MQPFSLSCFILYVFHLLQCAELPSQRAFLNQVLFNETIIAVIGAGCTAATKPIAEISNYWGLSMVCTLMYYLLVYLDTLCVL